MLNKIISRKTAVSDIAFIYFILIFSILSILSMNVAAVVTPGFSDGSQNLTDIQTVLSSAPTEITDPTSGVTVNIPVGALPERVTGVKFVVRNATLKSNISEAGTEAANKYAVLSGNTLKINSIFELELYDQNGNIISNFTDEITITIPVTDDSNGVAHFDETRVMMTVLPSVLQNGFITFKTTHFSYYPLVKISEKKSNPLTGENIFLFVILMILVSAAGVFIIRIRKQKIIYKK